MQDSAAPEASSNRGAGGASNMETPSTETWGPDQAAAGDGSGRADVVPEEQRDSVGKDSKTAAAGREEMPAEPLSPPSAGGQHIPGMGKKCKFEMLGRGKTQHMCLRHPQLHETLEKGVLDSGQLAAVSNLGVPGLPQEAARLLGPSRPAESPPLSASQVGLCGPAWCSGGAGPS